MVVSSLACSIERDRDGGEVYSRTFSFLFGLPPPPPLTGSHQSASLRAASWQYMSGKLDACDWCVLGRQVFSRTCFMWHLLTMRSAAAESAVCLLKSVHHAWTAESDFFYTYCVGVDYFGSQIWHSCRTELIDPISRIDKNDKYLSVCLIA